MSFHFLTDCTGLFFSVLAGDFGKVFLTVDLPLILDVPVEPPLVDPTFAAFIPPAGRLGLARPPVTQKLLAVPSLNLSVIKNGRPVSIRLV